MKLVVACDSFKGSLSSRRIGELVREAAARFSPAPLLISIPVADGGEGTLEAVASHAGYLLKQVACRDPLGRPIDAVYGIKKEHALIETAKASGLGLIPFRPGNPLKTSTFGTGQIMRDAVESGATHLCLCLGGSATNDGGMGALAALGCRFWDGAGRELSPRGGNLIKIARIDASALQPLKDLDIILLCDVQNPFVGENGATRVYGPQKGSTPENVLLLEEGMRHFADILYAQTGCRVHDLPGAGAAGGLAGGLIALLGAKMQSGIQTVLDLVNFDKALEGADAVITGEGKLDEQSLCGKAVSGVCERAKKYNVPVYVLAGDCTLSERQLHSLGIARAFTLRQFATGVADSIEYAEEYLPRAANALFSALFAPAKDKKCS